MTRTKLLGFLLIPLLAGCGPRISDVDMTDPGIAARIKAELKSHSLFDVRFLDVDTHMGIVTLSGIAESVEQKQDIARVVSHVPGVRQLVNNLAIQE